MAQTRIWRLLTVVVAAALLLAVAGCGSDDNNNGSSSKVATLESGKLKVGSDIPYKPFEFGDPPYQGFDVDIVNEIAKRLDLQAEFVKTPFDPIFRNLAQGRFDMVGSAATITPAREKTVDFSYPYFPSNQSLMVKRGSGITTTDQLAGKVVGAQLGTTGADYAKKIKGAKSVRTYDLVDDALKALEVGQIAGAVIDFPVTKFAERSKKDLQVVQTIPTGEQYGLAFKQGNTNLKNAVNKQLDAIKKDGTYTKIYRKWFQVDPPEDILKPGTRGSNAAGTEPVQ
jgi:ABC-type amino acid transport substrate-binding protein